MAERINVNTYFAAAAILSAFTCLIHATLGGRGTAGPLLAARELGKVAKFTAYYCWHLVTITLAGIALAFWLAASDPAVEALAIFATAGTAAFALWSLAMIVLFRLRLWHFPQWALFLPAAGLGLAGFLL